VIRYDPDGKKSSLKMVSTVLGCVIPETGKIVLLSEHQGISLPKLEHNLLSAMYIILHDAGVNKTPKFQRLEPTELLHTISVRGDNVDDELIIPLNLNCVVSCFPTLKPTK
jgi:hypothetical protein